MIGEKQIIDKILINVSWHEQIIMGQTPENTISQTFNQSDNLLKWANAIANSVKSVIVEGESYNAGPQ